MTLADLKKKPVVSMADGAKIGEVDDVVVDTSTWTIRDLHVAAKPGQGLLALASLKNIGPDAVTVEKSDVVSWNVRSPGVCFEAIKKLIVVEGSGTTIGHIGDLVYDPDGAIRSFEVRHGGVLGFGVQVTTITPMEIRGIGDRLITVELANTATATEPTSDGI